MQSKQIFLLYAPENAALARQIRQDLQSSFIRWVENPSPEVLEQELATSNSEKFGLILVSDNFLKSAACTRRLLVFTQDANLALFQPVLVDGQKLKNDSSGDIEIYPTNISTIHDTIYYRDFWYDEWIRLRKQGNLASEAELQALEGAKMFAKKMQPLMNTVLRHINHSNLLSVPDLQANAYQPLFAKIGLPHLSTAERQLPISQALAETEPISQPIAHTEINPVQMIEPMEWDMDLNTKPVEPITEPVVQIEEPIVQITEPVAQIEEPVVQIEEPVVQITEPVVQIEEPVVQITEPVVQMEEPVVQIEEPVVQIEEPVVQITEPVVQMEENKEFSLDFADIPNDFDHQLVFEKYKLNELTDLDTLFCLAETEQEEGDFENAYQCYLRILAIDSDNGRALLWLARLLNRHLERPQEAEMYYRKALFANDENANICYEYGLILQSHSPRRALDLFHNALEIDPLHDLSYLGLARAYAQLGQTAQAKVNYLQACALRDEHENEQNDALFGVLRRTPVVVEALPVIEEPAIEEVVEIVPPNPNHELTVLVTGASSGIGFATAQKFIAEGYKVVMAARRLDRMDTYKNTLAPEVAERVLCVQMDVCDLASVDVAFSNLSEPFQNIDVLVNNAGLAKGSHPIHEGILTDWDMMINTNIKGLLYVSRLVSAQMVARKKGHIINIGSAASEEPAPNGAVYAATKAAVDMLTRGMRIDLYKHKIRVSAVHPGMVEGAEFSLVRFDNAERAAAVYADIQPLTIEDVANTVYYIASQPAHVNIQEVLMYGSQQAGMNHLDRSGR